MSPSLLSVRLHPTTDRTRILAQCLGSDVAPVIVGIPLRCTCGRWICTEWFYYLAQIRLSERQYAAVRQAFPLDEFIPIPQSEARLEVEKEVLAG